MNALKFSSAEGGIVVTGKTFEVKEILKAHGASWQASASGWFFSGRTDVEALRAEVEAEVEAIAAAHKAELAAARAHRKWLLRTPEGQAHAAAEVKARVVAARVAGAYWICCDNCRVINWSRKTTACDACYPDGHIRICGCCYTGD